MSKPFGAEFPVSEETAAAGLTSTDIASLVFAEGHGVVEYSGGLASMTTWTIVSVHAEAAEAEERAMRLRNEKAFVTLEVEHDPDSQIWSERTYFVRPVKRTDNPTEVIIRAAYEIKE